MESRMKKYYTEEEHIPSRQAKNMDLYKDINSTKLDDFKVNSNVAVLDDNGTNIDIDRIRDMLDKKYRVEPKKKKIADYDEDLYQGVNLDETREYDINAILEKAKEKQVVNYEVERLKKIRNTQFDILNSLDLASKKEEDDEAEDAKPLRDDQAHLMELINTITSKELKQDLDPLDILTDLKGDENTMVVPGLKNGISEADKEEIKKEIKEEVKQEVKQEVKEELDKSFVTNTMAFTESDFDDFNDLKEDVKSNGIVIKILVVLVILVLIGGIVFMLNGIFEWGLF